MTRKLAAAVVLALAWMARGEAPAALEERSERIRGAAERALASLPAEAAREARFPFAADEREDIHYAPLWLEGVAHGDLSPDAAARVDELLAATLSPTGFEKVRSIRALEDAVARKERDRLLGLGRLSRVLRDPGRYLLAVFGEPAARAPFGFRYEGHHVSLNVTLAKGGAPATTPLFLGAQPRVVPAGWPAAGTQALREEEAIARALFAALPLELRERAALPYAGGRELMLGQVRRVALGPGMGVARREMPATARAQLDALIEVFSGNFAAEIANARRREIDAAGRDALRFAFAESGQPPGAFYWRIQGPRTLIEVDNTTDGDHVHAVWHDPTGDFGDDLLAAHYGDAHGVALAPASGAERRAQRSGMGGSLRH